DWQQKQPWLVGANFLPSSAINQLEMWQAESFDTITIDRELGWASAIGMNVMRVYLHDLAWHADPNGFKQRIAIFLRLADHHQIKILFTLFDDCWNPDPQLGPQPPPKKGVHNSGWVRSPSASIHQNYRTAGYLKTYVQDILQHFSKDERILLWDLYNEPGNSDYGNSSLSFLREVFAWAWTIRPSQPLTSAVWTTEFPEINAFQLKASDVITFHNYGDTVSLKAALDTLVPRGRPVLCSEYMARTQQSLIKTHLPIFKRYGVGAINWGLVRGKSNTIFPWGSPEGSEEPTLWFHDLFRANGEPYDRQETAVIKNLTAR
ncbi:MAG: cellulase family glycosylhydrolase, partial [Chitinophagaceae bacterium]